MNILLLITRCYDKHKYVFLGLDDWDIIGPVDFPQQKSHGYLDGSSLLGTLTTHVGKTVSRSMQKVMGMLIILLNF